jgi:hypothetical protein
MLEFLKNKHIIAAMIIAPILAIMAWFAVDYVVGEKPHKLAAGNTYKMVVKSNCRWGSGGCDLTNEDIEINLRFANKITLKSNVKIDGVKVALVNAENIHSTPQQMIKLDDFNLEVDLGVIYPNQFLQLIINTHGSMFYAVVPTIWTSLEKMPYEQK